MRLLELRCCTSRIPNQCYYIGLMKPSSTYWVDGSDSTYRSYKSGEPDKDDDICFVINCDSTEEMEDEECDKENKFICKMAHGKIGSRPSDHYFRSVCLSVCLCRDFLSRL